MSSLLDQNESGCRFFCNLRAVVFVTLDSSLTATAKVIDESSGITTVLPAG
jgi:hypothetical protein